MGCLVQLLASLGGHVNRRNFLLLMGASAAVWPRPGQAQPRPALIGVLSPFVDGENSFLADFRDGLRAQGHTEGRTIRLEYRSADGDVNRLAELAADLIAHKVDVIVTSSAPAIQTVRQATSRIPIVMARVGDAVDQGIVTSLGHPGGNVTGASWLAPELSGKALEALHEMVPRATRIALLREAAGNSATVAAVGAAAQRLGLRIDIFQVRDAFEIRDAFEAMHAVRSDGLIVLEGLMVFNNAKLISGLTVQNQLPAIFFDSRFVDYGGLISYGPNFKAMHRRAAYFVDRILKGASPADLPVEQPTEFELVVNIRSANALGLTVPPSFLLRADRLIE